MTTFLLKLGELTLKGGNRQQFEQILKRNLTRMLKGTGAVLNTTNGRFFIHCDEGDTKKVQAVEDTLRHLFGISGWAKAIPCAKKMDAILNACVGVAQELAARGVRSFKIEARRTDKSFPLDSYGIMREAGSRVLHEVPELSVDVHKPQEIIEVEIREKAYIYGGEEKGLRGLPVGTAGRGLLLLSGGIDSPVAGFLMAGRGMRMDAIHFHTYPYTSLEALKKTEDLTDILGRYAMGIRLFTLPFTKVQMRIREGAPEAWLTLLLRMAMMDAADRVAKRRGAKCLITGESLSQVASQTVENLRCSESRTTLPVLRPLIGLDKETTIGIAKKIGSYETSILPYEDCCVLFTPSHPILYGNLAEASEVYKYLDLDDLISQAIEDSSTTQSLAHP